MSLLGLLRHHTDGELVLFRNGIAGCNATLYCGDNGEDFAQAADTDPHVEWTRWLTAVADSRAVERQIASLDATCRLPWSTRPHSVRWVLTHAIEEYARHNGHADLLRQHIDGRRGV